MNMNMKIIMENSSNLSNNNVIVNKYQSDNFEFSVNREDTMFVLTVNNSMYKEGIITMITKIMTVSDQKDIDMDNMSKILGLMNIKNLNIFSINFGNQPSIDQITSNVDCNVRYTDISREEFVKFINLKDSNFFAEYNKDSLYILRGGNYIDIKNIFSKVKNHPVNIGRWRGPKSSCT